MLYLIQKLENIEQEKKLKECEGLSTKFLIWQRKLSKMQKEEIKE